MDIGEEDRDIAVCGEQLRNLDRRNEVAAVRTARSGSTYTASREPSFTAAAATTLPRMSKLESLTPVDLRVASLVDNLLYDLGIQDLRKILADEGKPLGRFRVGHCVSWPAHKDRRKAVDVAVVE